MIPLYCSRVTWVLRLLISATIPLLFHRFYRCSRERLVLMTVCSMNTSYLQTKMQSLQVYKYICFANIVFSREKCDISFINSFIYLSIYLFISWGRGPKNGWYHKCYRSFPILVECIIHNTMRIRYVLCIRYHPYHIRQMCFFGFPLETVWLTMFLRI